MQMPTTYANACSAARCRICDKECVLAPLVRRATSAFQLRRLVVGCNHGASLIRIPRPRISRWRKVVKNDLLKVIGVVLPSEAKAVATGNATGPVPKAIGDSAGPKASYGPKPPVPTPEAEERLRRAQQMKDERLQEQRRHAAEANYGYATSARPSPIGPPAAKKSPGVPTPKEHLVNLYNAVSEESKALAYDAMAKALSSPPVVKEPALPVKAMPPLPPWRQELFMHQMASQLSSMLMESLGMPVPPPPKPATLVIYGNPGPKMLPAAVEVPDAKAPEPKASLPACAVNEIAGDTTEEEEGEEPTRDD